MHSDFVHLHTRSEYSLLNSTARIDKLVKRAVELKAPALAITDAGNLFGAVEFYAEAMKQGVKPIIGMQTYISPQSRFDRQTHGIKEASFRLTLLAKDETGYKNLMKLSSIGYTEGFYYKPRVDKESLKKYSEGLIALSGDYKGEVPYYLLYDQPEDAKRALNEYLEIFGKENFYLEIMDHGLESDQKMISECAKLAKETGVKLVATHPIFYVTRDGAQAHDALICIGSGSKIEDTSRFRFQSDEYYMKSADEMKERFKAYPEAIKATVEIAERCNVKLEFGKIHLPSYKPPEGKTQDVYMRELCLSMLKERFAAVPPVAPSTGGAPVLVPVPKSGIPEHYMQRLEMELSLIAKMGFTSYFLIVWDFIRFSREKGIPVGPGRGSAAGSLVAYSLRITDADPIQHGLFFERFLNPERISMPDIDIDFCYERRDEVIDYVRKKYGASSVAQIITFGTMAARAAVRDVGRVMNFTYAEVDKIAKLIPMELGITIKSALEKEPELKTMRDSDARVDQLLKISLELEGLSRHASIHAAGVVISDRDLSDYVALYKTDEQICTQFTMGDLEKIGLLKMDFLGLRTLTVLHDAIKLIKQHRNLDLKLDTLPWEDPKTFEMLAKGDAWGVFQLESSGMRDLLKKMKPTKFDHLVALLALYRPGPLGSGMVDDFIKRMKNPSLIKYDHPKLEPALKETYGVILYQEQVMRIVSDLAGFTLARADSLRKAIGKKNPEVMAKEKENFVKGATMHGGAELVVAEKIWDLIDYFSGYGFNKSHSTAYALISYQTAYLKAHYAVEFMTALLTSEMNNTDKIVSYIEASRKMGIKILPPTVNDSFDKFTCGGDWIRFGLAAIKNVGHIAIESIVKARQAGGPFKSLLDFTQRVDLRVTNRKVMESLIQCGAFDPMGFHRSQLLSQLDSVLDAGAQIQKDKSLGQMSFFGGEDNDFGSAHDPLPDIPEWPEGQKLAYERELIGFYISAHPLSQYAKIIKNYASHNTETLAEMPMVAAPPKQQVFYKGGERPKSGPDVSIGAVIDSIREILTKKGDKMAFVQLQDLFGTCELVVFPKVYKEYFSIIKKDEIVFVKGTADIRDETPKILADSIVKIEDVPKLYTKQVHVDLQTTGLVTELLNDIKVILQKYKGKTPVMVSFRDPQGRRAMIDAGVGLQVETSDALFDELEALLGENSVKISA